MAFAHCNVDYEVPVGDFDLGVRYLDEQSLGRKVSIQKGAEHAHRSQEYVADMVASIMLVRTVPGSESFASLMSANTTLTFEHALQSKLDSSFVFEHDGKGTGAYAPERLPAGMGGVRFKEFWAVNGELFLRRLVEIEQCANRDRMAPKSTPNIMIPASQQVGMSLEVGRLLLGRLEAAQEQSGMVVETALSL